MAGFGVGAAVRRLLAEGPVELEVRQRPTVNVVTEGGWVELRLRYLTGPGKGQREALLLALRRGYFATPREVNVDELAAELGISRQAFPDRLRRGEEAILADALLADAGGSFDPV